MPRLRQGLDLGVASGTFVVAVGTPGVRPLNVAPRTKERTRVKDDAFLRRMVSRAKRAR